FLSSSWASIDARNVARRFQRQALCQLSGSTPSTVPVTGCLRTAAYFGAPEASTLSQISLTPPRYAPKPSTRESSAINADHLACISATATAGLPSVTVRKWRRSSMTRPVQPPNTFWIRSLLTQTLASRFFVRWCRSACSSRNRHSALSATLLVSDQLGKTCEAATESSPSAPTTSLTLR